MRPLRSSWRADDPGEDAEVRRGGVRGEAVAVDAGAPAVPDRRARRRRVGFDATSQRSYSQPVRWSTTVRWASEPPAGRRAVGDAHAHALDLAAPVGPGAVHREHGIVGGGPVGGVLEVAVGVGHAGAQVGRPALGGQPGHDGVLSAGAGGVLAAAPG